MGGRGGVSVGDLENIDPNIEIVEDSPIEVKEGKKRLRCDRFSPVFDDMNSGKVLVGQIFMHNFEI